MNELWLKYKDRIIHEFGFWLTLALGFAAADGADTLIALYNGDFSESVLGGLRMLLLSSIVKAVLVMVAPALFPLYRKDKGILPANSEPTEDNKQQ